MAVKEESRVRCEEISYKQYTTSDGKVFLSKSEAEVHDGLLKWSDTVRNFGVKNTGGAYHCRTEEEFNAVVNMIAYENYAYNYNERKFIPINYYENTNFPEMIGTSSFMKQIWIIRMSTGWKHCLRKNRNLPIG